MRCLLGTVLRALRLLFWCSPPCFPYLFIFVSGFLVRLSRSFCLSSLRLPAVLSPGVPVMSLGIVKSSFWMKSTRWRNQARVPSRRQTDSSNVRKGSGQIEKHLTGNNLFFQGRPGPSASTAKPTRTPNAASVPAACAAGSRMPTCSCCATSATWRSTSTASTRRSPPSPTTRTGESERAARQLTTTSSSRQSI